MSEKALLILDINRELNLKNKMDCYTITLADGLIPTVYTNGIVAFSHSNMKTITYSFSMDNEHSSQVMYNKNKVRGLIDDGILFYFCHIIPREKFNPEGIKRVYCVYIFEYCGNIEARASEYILIDKHQSFNDICEKNGVTSLGKIPLGEDFKLKYIYMYGECVYPLKQPPSLQNTSVRNESVILDNSLKKAPSFRTIVSNGIPPQLPTTNVKRVSVQFNGYRDE